MSDDEQARIYLVLVAGLSYRAHRPVLRDDGRLEWSDTAGVRHVAEPGDWEDITDRMPSLRFDN